MRSRMSWASVVASEALLGTVRVLHGSELQAGEAQQADRHQNDRDEHFEQRCARLVGRAVLRLCMALPGLPQSHAVLATGRPALRVDHDSPIVIPGAIGDVQIECRTRRCGEEAVGGVSNKVDVSREFGTGAQLRACPEDRVRRRTAIHLGRRVHSRR